MDRRHLKNYKCLLKLNYKEEDVLKIAYKNYTRLLRDVLKN